MLMEGKFTLKAPIQKVWDNSVGAGDVAFLHTGCREDRTDR